MKGKMRIRWYSIALSVLCLSACQVKRPDTVLPDATMENVLYDYHIAKAMGEDIPYNDSYKKVLYVESVFKKYGITQAQFDSSMVWFARNPDALTKVYEKVNQRLKARRDGINHLIALRENRPKSSRPGDSIDVWFGQRIYQLTGMPLDNKVAFTIPSDSNFHSRDTLRWSVRFQMLGKAADVLTAPVMGMQVAYAKDTVISTMLHVLKEGTNTLTLYADTLGDIKEIRGFVYYPKQEEAGDLLLDRISLMRYHAKDSLPAIAADTLQADSLRADSLRKDSLPKAKEDVQKLQETPSQQEERSEERARPRPGVNNVPVSNNTSTLKSGQRLQKATLKKQNVVPLKTRMREE